VEEGGGTGGRWGMGKWGGEGRGEGGEDWAEKKGGKSVEECGERAEGGWWGKQRVANIEKT